MDVIAYDYYLQAMEEQWRYWLSNMEDTIALKRAEVLYDKVMKLDSGYAPVWVYKGSIYMDRHESTKEYYEKKYLDSVLWYADNALSIDPENDLAHFQKGKVFHIKGDFNLAIKNYKKAIVLNQDNTTASLWRLGFIYIFKKDYIKGISLFRDAVRKARGSPKDYLHMLYRLGQAYMYIDAYEESKYYFDKLINLSGWCWFQWFADFYQGNFQTSLDYLSTCNHAESFNRNLYRNANTYLQLREFENALNYFKKYRERREEFGLIQKDNLYREGFVLIQLGYQKEGMELIEKQLSLLDKKRNLRRPDGYDYHYAAIYAFLGDQYKAMQHLRDYKNKVLYPPGITSIIQIGFIQYDVMFENLWDNVEFQAFVKLINSENVAAIELIRKAEEIGDLDI